MYPGAVDEALISDLGRVLDTYAGEDGEVFDFTNAPGYIHYLLGRDPATSFVHISMAAVELAQEDVVDQLAESRPPVVIFDNTRFGIASWDGPRSEVRHFEVAQYLLDHWTPVVAANGFLFLLRDDLVADAPAPPPLSVDPDTTDLYDLPTDVRLRLHRQLRRVRSRGTAGGAPVRQEEAFAIQVNGWAYDQEADENVPEVVVAVGRDVVGHIAADTPRPDVAEVMGLPDAGTSGFSGSVLFKKPSDGPLAVFGVVDGKAYVITPPEGYQAPKSLADGDRTIPVGEGRTVGHLEALEGGPREVGVAEVPAGVELADYELATFEADGPVGNATFSLTDGFGLTSAFGVNRFLSVGVLPVADDDISVRVGSCLQWHGFKGDELVIGQEGGRPISRVVLSDVAE